MVLATKVGRKRSFGLGLLLTVVTFGIYAVYWNYKAHNEIYKQFELAREGRDEGMVWYVLGLVLPPFLLAYLWVFASNVNYLRERIGLRRGTTSARLVTIVGLGVGAFALGIILLQAALVVTDTEPSADEVNAAVDAMGVTFLALAALAAVLLAFGYFGLQRDINELWDAYDARIAYLAAHPEELRGPEMAALGPAHAPHALAAPLRAEVDALRMRQPELRALPELEALVARADAGDAAAREEGERMLADLAAVLHERADLLRARAQAVHAGEDAGSIEERLGLLESALFDRARTE